jgi:hypothetical protein
MLRILSKVLLVVVLIVPAAVAEAPLKVTWENLVPPPPPLNDPLSNLSADHQVELELVYTAREMKRRGLTGGNGPPVAETLKLEDKLKQAGLDIDGLLARYHEYNQALVMLGEAVVPDLDNRDIRIAGFALPLEFTGNAVTEFLLVPYVGACIHSPPPPPNQMVFVRLNQSFLMKDLYTPVWVTGRLAIKSASKLLSLVDGRASVNTGYTMAASRVEEYKE